MIITLSSKIIITLSRLNDANFYPRNARNTKKEIIIKYKNDDAKYLTKNVPRIGWSGEPRRKAD